MRSSTILVSACIASLSSCAPVVLEERANICSAVDPVYSLLKTPLQAIATSLCSSYLGYPRSTSITVTASAATITATNTLAPSTTTLLVTQTNTIGSTATITVTDPVPDVTVTQTYTAETKTVYQKRDGVEKRALPPALATFAASKISSACSCIVTPKTMTATITAPNIQTSTITTNVPATFTVTVTSTVIVVSSITGTVTTHVTASPVTVEVTTTVTPFLVKPKMCDVKGLPGGRAYVYDANNNSNLASCMAECKANARCFSIGFFLVTDGATGTVSGYCRYLDKPVAESKDDREGYWHFYDKACEV